MIRTTIAMMIVATQAAAPQTDSLTAADVQSIARILVTKAPPWKALAGARADRSLFFDVDEAVRAFRGVAPRLEVSTIDLGRKFIRRSVDSSFVCDSINGPRVHCRVPDGGVVFRIQSVSRTATPGEYLIVASSNWTNYVGGQGFRMVMQTEFYVARVDGVWKIVRVGGGIIS